MRRRPSPDLMHLARIRVLTEFGTINELPVMTGGGRLLRT